MTGSVMGRTRDIAAAGALAAIAVAIAWLYYTGLYCSDDTRYLLGAIRIAVGEDISTASLAERRVALLIPAAAMYAATRSIDWAIAIYPLFYVGLGIMAYALARLFFPVARALLAALLALAQPALFLYSGALMPDLGSAFFIVLALYLLCRMILDDDRRRQVVFAVGTGAGIGAAFALKESSAIVLAAPLALLVAGMARKRPVAAPAVAMFAGLAAVLLLESILFRFTAGHWYSSIASLLDPHDFSRYVEVQGRTPLARLKTLGLVLGPHTTGLFLFAGLACVQLLSQTLRGRLAPQDMAAWWVIAGFWAWPVSYFTLGSVSLAEYAPPVIQQRYYAPFVAPAALLAVRLFVSAAGAGRAAWLRGAGRLARAAAVLLLLSGPWAQLDQRGLMYGAPAKEAFVLAMADMQQRFPGLPVVDTDTGWTTDLNRCRALLWPEEQGGSRRLLEAIASGSDRRGWFGYREPGELDGPHLLVGHGKLPAAPRPSRWGTGLQEWMDAGGLALGLVGVYAAPTADELGVPWQPRELAVRRVSAASAPQATVAPAPADADAEPGAAHGAPHQTVKVHLVTPMGDPMAGGASR